MDFNLNQQAFPTASFGHGSAAAHPQHFQHQQQPFVGGAPASSHQHHPPHSPYPSADPPARFAPQQQGHGGGAVGSIYPHAASSMNMNVAEPGMLPPAMAQHQYLRGQHQNMFSNAPFSHALSAPSSTSTPQPQQYGHATSPPNRASPYGTPQNPNRQSQTSNGAPQQMNPLQTSLPLTSAQTTPQSASKANAQPPISPSSVTKEQEKVTQLLSLNSLLLQEIVSLQNQGKSGPIGQPMPPKEEDETGKPNAPAKEFLDCMRCLQSNLAFLAQLGPNKPVITAPPRGPAIMDPPPTVPQSVKEAFEKLKPLFPGWNGLTKPSPRQGNAALPGGQQS